jgi:hypothetical protein
MKLITNTGDTKVGNDVHLNKTIHYWKARVNTIINYNS